MKERDRMALELAARTGRLYVAPGMIGEIQQALIERRVGVPSGTGQAEPPLAAEIAALGSIYMHGVELVTDHQLPRGHVRAAPSDHDLARMRAYLGSPRVPVVCSATRRTFVTQQEHRAWHARMRA